ncbi:hypothetical protein B0H19DRAFT_1248065 [Mycena capillaripes]|nr:hypothetical protein B0H19DRAFT_1248065 [Mycena capillaripes]
MTRNIKASQAWQSWKAFRTGIIVGGDSDLYPTALDLNQENITMAFFYITDQISVDTPPANVTVAKTFLDNALQICDHSIVSSGDFSGTSVVCPYSWSDLSISVFAGDLIVSGHFTDPRGVLYVKPGQGDPAEVNSYTEAIPLMAGSHLAAILSRKQRDLYSKNAQWGIFSSMKPLRSIIVTPVLLLQPDPFPPDLAANSVSLRLRMRHDILKLPAEIRHKLTQNWNEDSPALHTEGGQPGSKSAGIVAFLRERLVDLDEEDRYEDLKAQNAASDPLYQPIAVKEKAYVAHSISSGSQETHSSAPELEEIPLSSELGSQGGFSHV